MASKVVFIRVNPTIYPIDHIAVNHIALDSIPHGSSQNTTWIVFHTTISHKYQPIYFCILKRVGGLLTYMFILILQKEFGK